MPPGNRIIKEIFFFLLSVIFFLLISFYIFLRLPPSSEKSEKIIEISEGMIFRSIADLLKRERLITYKSYFILLGKYRHLDRRVRAGEYLLNTVMPPGEILTIFKNGSILQYDVAIPEGYTARQIAQLLSEKKLADYTSFMDLTYDKNFIRSLGVDSPSLEGYLFPDTYKFPRRIRPEEIIRGMVKRFLDAYTPDLIERARMLEMTTNEVVTLASIIEKETSKKDEKLLVSAVFHNRLKKGIRLQSDPTVIYILPVFEGGLSKKDLKIRSAYNTYINRGLPPGPISNPGRDSIVAVLYPAKADHLYFVSKNDGTHHFSKTLDEHNHAVKIYQKGGV